MTMFEDYKKGVTDCDGIAKSFELVNDFMMSGDFKKEVVALQFVSGMEARHIAHMKKLKTDEGEVRKIALLEIHDTIEEYKQGQIGTDDE